MIGPRSRMIWLAAGVIAAGLALIVVRESRLHGVTAAQVAGEMPALRVIAGIPPVAYLAERLGGKHVRVEVLAEPGQDPHLYMPSPRQVMALSKARLLLKVGMPFEERLIERVARRQPDIRVVDTARGIRRRKANGHCCDHGHADHDEHGEDGHAGHDHEEACESCSGHGQVGKEPHEHEEDAAHGDPHVWLAPPLLKIMAANIAEALGEADPPHRDEYRANLAALEKEIDELHARITVLLAPYRGQSFYVFHPAFAYFGDAYGLQEEAVEVEGKSPTPRQLQHLIEQARAEGVKIVFFQPQFDPRSAKAVAAAIGGVAEPMDDLAKDVLKNLDDVARKIADALQNCKLTIANCKLKIASRATRPSSKLQYVAAGAWYPTLQFAICNLQYAIERANHA